MNLSEAERILGVKAGASAEEVKRAFSEEVKRHHPDSGVIYLLHGEARRTMKELKQARDILLERHMPTGLLKPCPICRGTGIQMVGMRRVPCVRGCEEG